MNCHWLNDRVAIRGQISPGEVGQLAQEGFSCIVNVRPDGEQPGQPLSAELEEEARRHGLGYCHIPVVPGRATEQDAAEFARAVDSADGSVIAFCRTGQRADGLWQMAGKPG